MEKVSHRYYRKGMSKPPAPSDAADKFMLRLPDGMRDRLKAKAESNKRSMNAEIVARLETTLTHQERFDRQLDRLEAIAEQSEMSEIPAEDWPLYMSNFQDTLEKFAKVCTILVDKAAAHQEKLNTQSKKKES